MQHQLARIPITGLGQRVTGFCTTRAGGMSQNAYASLNLAEHVQDDPQRVTLNRRTLEQALPDQPVWLNQVHGTDVLRIGRDPVTEGVQADASVTTERDRVLAIMTADCLPVVLTNNAGTVLGVAHAGWRGLANGVLSQTLQAMQQAVGSIGAWRAWIGPCISQQCFQVGSDVLDAFTEIDPALARFFLMDSTTEGKWLCDLPAMACHLLMSMGAEKANWCGLCTVSDAEQRFYSYRRDGQTGRMATVAWLSAN